MTRHGGVLSLLLLVASTSSFNLLSRAEAFSSHHVSFGSALRVLVAPSLQHKGYSGAFVPTTTRLQPFPRVDSLTHAATTTSLSSSPSPPEEGDVFFNGKTTITLIGGQSLLIVSAVVAATVLQTPNYGFGPGINFQWEALQQGVIYALPLGVVAYLLDAIEDQVPALQDVTKATQRSIIYLLGSQFKPTLAILTSIALGLAAGFGEEMLFRGVLQYELTSQFGAAFALGSSSIVFGALHAVTPLYALFASLASVYFGFLFQSSGNLAIPIVTHTVYDVGALFWAHWTVTQMTSEERDAIVKWKGPNDSKEIDVL